MIKSILKVSLLSIFIACFFSCNPFGIQGPEPVFLNITEPEFVFDLEKGPRNQRIQSVEVFFENFSIGFYELPAEIAIIPTQEISSLTIFPAIQRNGQITEFTPYTRMREVTIERNWVIGETYDITPQFDYKESTIFDYVETFEDGNSFNFDGDDIDSTITERVDTYAADGNFSCKLSTERGDINAATNFLFTGLSNDNKDVFMELNYKSDAVVEVGVRLETTNESLDIPFIFLDSQSDWRKVYLDLSPLFAQFPAPGYRFYLSMEGPSGENAREAFFDNIKVLRQE